MEWANTGYPKDGADREPKRESQGDFNQNYTSSNIYHSFNALRLSGQMCQNVQKLIEKFPFLESCWKFKKYHAAQNQILIKIENGLGRVSMHIYGFHVI